MSIVFTSERVETPSRRTSMKKFLIRTVSKSSSRKHEQAQATEVAQKQTTIPDRGWESVCSQPESADTSTPNVAVEAAKQAPKLQKKSLARKVSAAPILERKTSSTAETNLERSPNRTSLSGYPAHSQSMIQISGMYRPSLEHADSDKYTLQRQESLHAIHSAGTDLSHIESLRSQQLLIRRARSASTASSSGHALGANGTRMGRRQASIQPSFSIGSGFSYGDSGSDGNESSTADRDNKGRRISRQASANSSIVAWDAKGRRISRQNSISATSDASESQGKRLSRHSSITSSNAAWDSKGRRLSRQESVTLATDRNGSRTRSESVKGYSKKRVSVEISSGVYREKPSFVPVAVVKPTTSKTTVPMISAPRIRNLA